jgi:hypothetical protein
MRLESIAGRNVYGSVGDIDNSLGIALEIVVV